MFHDLSFLVMNFFGGWSFIRDGLCPEHCFLWRTIGDVNDFLFFIPMEINLLELLFFKSCVIKSLFVGDRFNKRLTSFMLLKIN